MFSDHMVHTSGKPCLARRSWIDLGALTATWHSANFATALELSEAVYNV